MLLSHTLSKRHVMVEISCVLQPFLLVCSSVQYITVYQCLPQCDDTVSIAFRYIICRGQIHRLQPIVPLTLIITHMLLFSSLQPLPHILHPVIYVRSPHAVFIILLDCLVETSIYTHSLSYLLNRSGYCVNRVKFRTYIITHST